MSQLPARLEENATSSPLGDQTVRYAVSGEVLKRVRTARAIFQTHTSTFEPSVAYSSNESGQFEVYVRPFPEGGRKVTVSSNGGTQVRWSRDGKELFYVEGATLVAVSVSSGPAFSAGSVARLFEHLSLTGSYYPQYDVSADGRRFILAESAGLGSEAPQPSIRVVMNWYEEFRDREQD